MASSSLIASDYACVRAGSAAGASFIRFRDNFFRRGGDERLVETDTRATTGHYMQLLVTTQQPLQLASCTGPASAAGSRAS